MKNQKLLNKIFLATMLLAIPTASFGAYQFVSTAKADISYTGSHYEDVSLSNSSFDGISTTYASNDVSGWSRIRADGSAKMMIIDTEKNYDTNVKNQYYLSSDFKINDNSANENDHKILMINSALKAGQTDGYAREGYRSQTLSFSANSFYYIQLSMNTKSLNSATAFGSIYLNGLEDKDGNKVAFERQSALEWTNYYFYIATGDEDISTSIDLWLGTEDINSYGVAFFDEVYVKKFSENLFYENLTKDHMFTVLPDENEFAQSLLGNTGYIKLPSSEKLDMSDKNFDFEKDIKLKDDTLVDWEIDHEITNSSSAHAEVMNMLSESTFESKVKRAHPGTNFGRNNTQSLVLWTDSESSVAVTSKEIPIKSHGLYKISMSVKTDIESGSFFISAEETDSIYSTFVNLSSENYKLHSGKSSGISSTNGSSFTNGYERVSFYVEGNNFYDSAVKLKLSLGTGDEKALGCVVIDDITVEMVNSEEFSNASNKLSLAISPSSETIANGYFNFTESKDSSLTYPLQAKNWVLSQEDSDYMVAGIINTYKDDFSAYRSEYASTWGKVANPAAESYAPPTTKDYKNNVFMFWNSIPSYQSIKTADTFTVSAEKYYELSFDFKTYDSSFTVELVNDDGVVLYSDANVSANGTWQKYKAYVYTGEASHKAQLIIHFGSSKAKVEGYGFLDNVKLTESNEASFNASLNTADLSNFLLNLDPYKEVGSKLSNHSAFTGKLNNGLYGEGGVIIGNGNESYTTDTNKPLNYETDLPNNVLVISVLENSSYTLTSKFKVDLEANSYYSLKFKLLTSYLPEKETLPEKDEKGNKIDYSYGVSVGLSGFDNVTTLKNNDGWKEYTILFKATESKSANFVFSLISDNKNTFGTAYLTDIVWTKTEESVFSSAEDKEAFGKTLFTATATDESSDENKEDEETTDETNISNEDINWLLIPSLIFGVAIVIAILGWLIRKIRLGKKGVTQGKETYDRKATLDKNVVKVEAKKKRDAEAKLIEGDIEKLSKEIKDLEEAHKTFIAESRAKGDGKITKEIEKQFKSYSSKHAKLSDKLALSKEHLENVNSPEYLISLENKLESEYSKALTNVPKQKSTSKSKKSK